MRLAPNFHAVSQRLGPHAAANAHVPSTLGRPLTPRSFCRKKRASGVAALVVGVLFGAGGGRGGLIEGLQGMTPETLQAVVYAGMIASGLNYVVMARLPAVPPSFFVPAKADVGEIAQSAARLPRIDRRGQTSTWGRRRWRSTSRCSRSRPASLATSRWGRRFSRGASGVGLSSCRVRLIVAFVFSAGPASPALPPI